MKKKENIKIKKTKLKGNQLIRQLFLSSYYYSFFFSILKSTRLLSPPLPKPFLFILNLLPRRDHPSTCQRCNLIGSLLHLEVSGQRSAVGYAQVIPFNRHIQFRSPSIDRHFSRILRLRSTLAASFLLRSSSAASFSG